MPATFQSHYDPDCWPASMTAEDRLAAYRRDGFTLFRDIHTAERLRNWCDVFPALSEFGRALSVVIRAI